MQEGGFIGLDRLQITCESNGYATGAPSDVDTHNCKVEIQGDDPSTWGYWDGEIERSGGNGTTYVSVQTE